MVFHKKKRSENNKNGTVRKRYLDCEYSGKPPSNDNSKVNQCNKGLKNHLVLGMSIFLNHKITPNQIVILLFY